MGREVEKEEEKCEEEENLEEGNGRYVNLHEDGREGVLTAWESLS